MYARVEAVELLRFPGFTVATLASPVLVFALFGLPRAGRAPELLLASYAGFAVLGVGFFQFGVARAIERDTPWALYVRTLPAPPGLRLAGRVLCALGFAAAAAGTVVALALAATPASLSAAESARLALALLAGSIPFVLLGSAIAYWSSARAALPLANILYVLLAYAGGLWTGPGDLPALVARISPATPTRQWGTVLWASVTGAPWRPLPWLLLAAYAVAFGGLAAWGYRRDEGRRFR